jgi:hypothetical protein
MAYSNQSDSYEYDYTPGFTKNTHEYGVEFGDEFHAPAVVELLASMVAYRQRGVTLAGGQGVVPTGCVIARHTASGKYVIYQASATDGRQTAIGILRDGRDTGGSGGTTLTGLVLSGTATTYSASPGGKVATDCQGNLVYGGTLNLAALSGTDNNNITGAAGGFGSGLSTVFGGRVVTFGAGVGTPPFAGSAMDNSSKAVFIF